MGNIDRSQIQLQTISNLITAGVLNHSEAWDYNAQLSAMAWDDLLAALVESHELREDCSNPVNHYPIGEICEN